MLELAMKSLFSSSTKTGFGRSENVRAVGCSPGSCDCRLWSLSKRPPSTKTQQHGHAWQQSLPRCGNTEIYEGQKGAYGVLGLAQRRQFTRRPPTAKTRMYQPKKTRLNLTKLNSI